MTNPETHRQFYLATAGIRMWYAKRPLPGAAPSPEYQFSGSDLAEESAFQDLAEVPAQPQVKVKHRESPVPRRSVDLQALMASPAESGVSEERFDSVVENADKAGIVRESETPSSQAKTQAPAAAADQEEAPKPAGAFGETSGAPRPSALITAHLGIWSSESYLLISQWSDEASERLQDSLARNLLRTLHQADVGERRMLHWPVFGNPHIPGNSADDFREVLSCMVSSSQNRSVILLGVLCGEQDEPRQHCLKPVLPRVGVDFPYSLAELSATPTYKRDLWKALKSCYSV